MTDQSDNTVMTDDRFSPVDPHYARAQSRETTAEPQSVITTPTKTYDHALTEPAQLTHCTHCQQPVIRAHTDGLLVTCDPQPLTPTNELTALLAGRLTYQLVPVAGHTELQWRHLLRIRANHPHPVIATHHCPPDAHTRPRRRQLPPPITIPSRPAAMTPPNGATPPF